MLEICLIWEANIQYSSCVHILFPFIAHIQCMCDELCQKLETTVESG